MYYACLVFEGVQEDEFEIRGRQLRGELGAYMLTHRNDEPYSGSGYSLGSWVAYQLEEIKPLGAMS